MKKAGIYIHIPFCKSKCPYCDFYSVKLKDYSVNDYTDFVVSEIEKQSDKYNISADTLYIGGGTPSAAGGKNIAKIVDAAKALGDFEEVTVECNPSSTDEDFLKEIAYAGVNRISFGLQSACDDERRSLGRKAGIREAEKCIEESFKAGIKNISVDVMLGIPNQKENTFGKTLDFCTGSGVSHISAYMLKLEEGTEFYKKRDKINIPDDDFTADLYLEMVSILESRGFYQYEISNFAKAGYESRHNMKYWECCEYLGIGPSAHSFINGKRFYYPRDIEYVVNGGNPVDDGSGGDVFEYIMLGLRLRKGIRYDKIREYCGCEKTERVLAEAKELEKAGFTETEETGFHLTGKGFLVSNSVIERIISKVQ